MAGGNEGGKQQTEHPLRDFLSTDFDNTGVHMQGDVANGHQAGGLKGPWLPVGASASPVGVQGLVVAAGAKTNEVSTDKAQVIAQGGHKVFGIYNGDGVFEVDDVRYG